MTVQSSVIRKGSKVSARSKALVKVTCVQDEQCNSRILPWGTPAAISNSLDLNLSWTTRICREVRLSASQRRSEQLMPAVCALWRSPICNTRSKAPAMSTVRTLLCTSTVTKTLNALILQGR